MIIKKLLGIVSNDHELEFNNLLKNKVNLGLSSTILIRKEVFKKINGFDTDILIGSDSDFLYQIARRGLKQHMINRPLAYIRHNEHSLSHSRNENQLEKAALSCLKVYEKLMDKFPSENSAKLIKHNLALIQLKRFFLHLYKNNNAQIKQSRLLITPLVENDNLGPFDFYIQVFYFSTMIFDNDGWEAMKAFIQKIYSERNNFLNGYSNQQEDEITRIRACALCAARGKYKHI